MLCSNLPSPRRRSTSAAGDEFAGFGHLDLSGRSVGVGCSTRWDAGTRLVLLSEPKAYRGCRLRAHLLLAARPHRLAPSHAAHAAVSNAACVRLIASDATVVASLAALARTASDGLA